MSIFAEVKALPVSPKDLRKFAVTVGGVFGLLGGIFFWRGKGVAVYLLVLAATLLIFGFLIPRALKYIYWAWMGLALAMGWVMTRVILSVIFFAVIAPIGLLMRIRKKDLLNLRFKSDEASYWVPRVPRERSTYEKQY